MGLDNGIVVKNIPKEAIPYFVKLPYAAFDENGSIDMEIIYFRKCWGIREAIFNVIHGTNLSRTEIDIEDIPAIIRALEKFCSKEYWDENAESIWTFEEAFDFILIQQIINLKWLYFYWQEHPEVTAYFYDSY